MILPIKGSWLEIRKEKTMNRNEIQKRTMNLEASKFQTREEEDAFLIEGYFAIFNSIYELWDGATEEISKGAFANTLEEEVRALVNHDSTLVLGRNKSGTLGLKEDDHGLWGSIKINPKDSDAVNLYERVKRGDVSQCSFGFEIIREETEFPEEGKIHWRILEVRLHEVSVCTFPAYKETEVSARKEQAEEIEKRKIEAWKKEILANLKGEK